MNIHTEPYFLQEGCAGGKLDYLHLIALQDNTDITLKATGTPYTVQLEYSFDKKEWSTYTIGNVIKLLNTKDVVYFRGDNSNFSKNYKNYYSFSSNGNFAAYGDTFSLLDGSRKTYTCTPYCFFNLFLNCTGLTTAPELPATTLDTYCYYAMFSGCTSLTTAPELPATTLGGISLSCYKNMFLNCNKLNFIAAFLLSGLGTTYTENWLSGVSATGTFVRNADATWESSITRGASTVPSGWTITTNANA